MNTSCLWDVSEMETTSLDETKVVSECEPCSTLYQVETCVRVTPRSASGHVGRVLLCSSSDVVVAAVENQLMLFNTSDWKLSSTLNFESLVDCVACNDDGTLLVVGERCGNIHAISAKTSERLAFQWLESTFADSDTSLFKAAEFGLGQNCRLAVLTSTGHLHVIDGLQTLQLKHSLVNVSAVCLTVLTNSDIITCNADESLNLWSNEDGQFSIVRSCPMFGLAVKCVSLPCGERVVVLDSDGQLVLWNTSRFVAVSVLGCAGVVDFVLVDQQADCLGTIAAVQKCEISCCVNIYSIPHTECIYSVDVHSVAILFPSSVLNGNVYFLETSTEDSSLKPTDAASCWQVRRLAETNPQSRLRRLLAKQRFSEAESFAEKYDLDVQLVYHEYVCHLVRKLSASADDATELISELIKCLGQLNDVPFVVECCITTTLPKLAATSQLLSLAHEKLEKSRHLSEELHAALDSRLQETSQRFAAFQATFRTEELTVECWRHFRSVDMYEELCHWLKVGRLDIVSTLCGRFAVELSEKLTFRLDATLALLPDEVVIDDLCAWLTRAIVPLVVKSQDFSMISSLAVWLEKRASNMEVTQKHSWPENAIQLCEVLATNDHGTLFKNVTLKEYACQIVGFAMPQTSMNEARQSDNALVRLHMLHSDLQQIVKLCDQFNCSLSLAEFRSATTESLAYHLLDRVVAVELIASAISDMVRPYARQNCLRLDDLLSSYIEELVHRHSAVWEAKAIEILGSISDRVLRERTLMSILSKAKFPWSDEVSDAVATALAKNPSHAGLKGERQLASLKYILSVYGLQSFSFVEMAHSEDLAYYILVQDKVTAVEDALVVTEMHSNVNQVDVYLFRCCFLSEHNRADEVVGLLRGITCQAVLDEVCERFVEHCGRVLSNPISNFHHHYATAASHIRRMLTTLSSDSSRVICDQLSDLDAVYRLDTEFGVSISVNDLSTVAKRQQAYDQYLSSLDKQDGISTSEKSVSKNAVATVTEKTTSVVKVLTKGSQRKFAHLLRMSPYDEVIEAVRVARRGDIHSAIQLAERIVRRSSGNSTDVVRLALRILKAVCESIENGSSVTDAEVCAIHRISCHMLLTAPSYILDQCLWVVRSTRLAVEMAAQCSTDNSFVTVSSRVDPYKHWTFDDYLADDCGLIMDSKSALPLAFAFVAACLPSTDYTLELPVATLQQIVDVTEKIAQTLTAHDQTRLSVGYFLELAAFTGRVTELDKLNRAIIATLKQSVSQRRADYRLALTTVLSLSPAIAKENLKKLARSAGIQYKKSLAVAQVGLAFAQLTNDSVALLLAQNVVTEARWGYRLAKVHVSFHECFKRGTDAKKALICTLAANDSISVDDVIEYCEDFKLDVNDSLCVYLTCLLLPSPNSTNSVPAKPFSDVQQRAVETCCHIQRQSLITNLEKIFEMTSPYDYDRLEFILDRLLTVLPSDDKLQRSLSLSMIERNKKLLVFLKSYHRISAPSEEWDELMSGDNSRERLPFHTLTVRDQHWPIITAELNADTVDLWIPMAAVLGHLPDEIYTTAIRNIVLSHVSELPSEAQWSEASVNADFMETVHRLVSKVTKIDLAVPCVSWIARELPPGAEKVVAYSWCVYLLEKHVASCSADQRSRTTAVLEKHRFCSRQTAIEQVLHISGLAEPSLVALSSLPAKLMFRLYEHPSVADRVRRYNFLAPSPSSSAAIAGLPDVHAVVDRIATVGSVDACKVRRALLDQWLTSHVSIQQLESADVTMVGEDSLLAASGQVDVEDGDGDDVDLLRAVYLLQHPDMCNHDTLLMLINCASDSSADGTSVSQQIRAVRCLFLLADLSTVQELSGGSNWHDYLADLLYMVELRRLRVFTAGSRESFEMVDKSGLVRALCRSRDDKSGPVAASLAIDFHLSDPLIWNAIVRRLTKSSREILLRPLPCQSRDVLEAVNSLFEEKCSESDDCT